MARMALALGCAALQSRSGHTWRTALSRGGQNAHARARSDPTILAVLLYAFVRVGASVRMRVRDFQAHDVTAWLVLREKGGKGRRLPAHHLVRDYVLAYLDGAGLNGREHAKAPLFQSAPGRSKSLSGKPLDRSAVLGIVKRRCRHVRLPERVQL
jgi:integrase